MILPIVTYGADILRQIADPVEESTPRLQELISNMKATMINARGAGLAASQVNRPLQLFLIETDDYFGVFINPAIIWYSEDTNSDTEGCLSIPGISQSVTRSNSITIRWQDELFAGHEQTFHGETARAIQHEYDHTQGILYLDHLQPLQRTLLKNKLQTILRGGIKTPYPMLRL
ncbi:peptide deformylase [Chitinophaga silvatica]|uniref:Peptide deformylase n=2 Tax=Chitinophaga silvatica TaxID=2282649 RepID=A0A3E1YB47_9BACT|nr:peptide deformylase [Chitinophaga silvatica]